MATKVDQVNIIQIEDLAELIQRNPDFFVPVRDAANKITYKLKIGAIISSETVSAGYSPTENYNDGRIVQANGKWWQSLITDGVTPNIGNYPTEGSFWTEISKSVADGAVAYWSAGVFTVAPQISVVKANGSTIPNDIAFLLKSTVTLPFNSTASPETDPTNWLQIGNGSSISVASNADMDTGTDDTKFVSSLKFVYGITTRVFSGLSTTVKTIQGAINELLALLNITQDVNVGFCSKCPVLPNDVLRDDTTRTLTIATVKGGTTISASNPIRFYTAIDEVKSKWEKSTPQSVVWDNTKGLKYFYFDNDGVLKVSNSPWAIGSITFVWRLYWNPAETGTKRIVREAWECHPNTISASDHTWKHSQGAIWIRNSGLDLVCTPLASGAPSASGVNTCLSLTGGRCQDDNLQYTITNSTTPANFSQDLGNTTAANITTTNGAVMDITYNAPDGTLTIIDGTRFAFHAISSVPQIITAGGVITPVSNGYFFNYYIYAFQDPRFGKVISLRSGLSYATKAEADAETWETIKAASPTLQDGEVKQLYKSTWEYRTSYDAAINKAALRGFVDLRSNAALSATVGGGSGASIASNVSVTPPTGYTSVEMQSLSNEFGAAIDSKPDINDSLVNSVDTWSSSKISSQIKFSGSPFDPQSISALQHWYDATLQSSVNGTPVSSLYDIVGGATMLQATGANQPTRYYYGGMAGLPYIEITSTKFLKSAALTGKTQPYTIITVIKPKTFIDKKAIINFDSNTNAISTYLYNGGQTIGSVAAAAWTANQKWFNEWQVLLIEVNGTNTKCSFNFSPWSSISKDSPGTGVPVAMGLGISGGCDFDFCELMYFNGSLKTADFLNLRSYFAIKYNMLQKNDFYLIGDSISDGTAASNRLLSFGFLVSNYLTSNWLDYAITGSTIYTIIEQYGQDPYFNRQINGSGYYAIAMGTNETLIDNTWKETWRARLLYAHDNLGYDFKQIVFITPPYYSTRVSKLAQIQAIGVEFQTTYGITYADCVTTTLAAGGDALMADTLHPTTAGHAVMAQTIIDAIAANL